MSPEQLMAALAALPDPDLLTDTKLTDPPGAGAYYRADTVVRLLLEAQPPRGYERSADDRGFVTGPQVQQRGIFRDPRLTLLVVATLVHKLGGDVTIAQSDIDAVAFRRLVDNGAEAEGRMAIRLHLEAGGVRQ